MKRAFCLTLPLYLFATIFISAQNLQLPRNSEKLVERVQRFWAAMVSNRRVQALEFILPEKKDLLLSGNPMPILSAKVIGLDLTSDPNRAAVRTNIETLSQGAASGRATWTITDLWLWRGDNWYLNLENPPDIFPGRKSADEPAVGEIQKQIEKTFELLRNPVDLGTLTEGEHLRFDIPIKYTGNFPVSVELGLANSLVDLDTGTSIEVTSKSNHLVLLVDTQGWEGPFNIPLPLRIRSGAAATERTLIVEGNVFAPVVFRQEPPDGPIEAGRPISVFIRNNTPEEARFQVNTDAKFEILKRPETLLPNAETEVVLKLKPGESPDQLHLELGAPIHGRTIFSYRFRNVRR